MDLILVCSIRSRFGSSTSSGTVRFVLKPWQQFSTSNLYTTTAAVTAESCEGLKATIKLRSDGKVNVSGFRHRATGWHGSWQWDPEDHNMEITFNYKGNEAKMKTAAVYLAETLTHNFQEVWGGRDDDQRSIEMRLMDQMRFCEFHNCWHKCTPARPLGFDHVLS